MDELERIRKSSQYLATLLRREQYLNWLWNQRNLYRRYPLAELYHDLQSHALKADSFDDLLKIFRAFKQRHFLRIGGRDLLGFAGLSETTSQLSDLASAAFQVGLEMLREHPEWWAGDERVGLWKEARDGVELTIIGLGKLGGQELNYVSDVDILFMQGFRDWSQAKAVEGSILLDSLCRKLSGLLSDRLDGDRVFEVDFRLRPMGKDGTLVPLAAAAAEHYLLRGHPWERQMLLKARPIAGSRPLGMAFLQEVRPFIFRRFLDFQALGELRAMRDRIIAEAAKPRSGWEQFDVKLGIGGIREIEFFVQSLQLIYGGRHPELDEPNTLRCLKRLTGLGLLEEETARQLGESYTFLRRVEHWVQLDQNRQTQKLPRSEDALARLALALGFDEGEKAFFHKLKETCTLVHGHFLALFEGSGGAKGHEVDDSDRPLAGSAAEKNFIDAFPSEAIARLKERIQVFPSSLQELILNSLEPFAKVGREDLRESAVVSLERYFGALLKRPGLIKVLDGSGPWIAELCQAISRSEFVSDLLSHHPGLVEGLAMSSGTCPAGEVWEKHGNHLLERVKDFEEKIEWVRRLKNERILQLTLLDLRTGGDYTLIEHELTRVADFTIHHTYEAIREHLGIDPDWPLAILGLGRFGSREMSYLSDLDLVFVYEPAAGEPSDTVPGDAVRLIQRLMRLLSTPLHDGPGYAVDARLRPTGNYGPLVVTCSSWLDYFKHRADIWEIQALLRIRRVAGRTDLGIWIEEKAHEICYSEHSAESVWPRLCHLRKRMQLERGGERPNVADIKFGPGGLTDLEFFVQGHLLLLGSEDPSLRTRSVREALPPVLERVLPGDSSAQEIMDAFNTLRALEHRLRLYSNQSTALANAPVFDSLHECGLWPPKASGRTADSWEDILRLRRRARALLQSFCPDL